MTTTQITIIVTQEHIDKADPRSGTGCPIALAIQEQGYPYCFISPKFWTPDISIQRPYLPLPIKAQHFIEDFDNPNRRSHIKPTIFTLEIPE